MTELLYEASGLAKSYGVDSGRVDALRGVDVAISPGEFVAVTGPSGSGKSTLLGLFGLLAQPSSGYLHFRGRDVSRLDHAQLAKLRRSEIGFVFQAFQLIDRMPALENVELPLVYADVPRRERSAMARAALERVGLAARAHHEPSQLSGGEQQRVAIARAIVNHPRIVLADEPTGALDSTTGAEVMALLHELNRGGTSVIVITHNPQVAASVQRRLRIADGLLERDGAIEPVAGATL